MRNIVMELDIRVQPRASRNAIEFGGERPDVKPGVKIMVRVTAAPEGGKANDAVVALLAKRLRAPKRSVQIVRGHRSRNKRIHFEGLTATEAIERLKSSSVAHAEESSSR